MSKFLNLAFLTMPYFLTATSFAATHKEIVKDLYETGTAPAVAEDFPQQSYKDGSFIGPRNNICVVIDGGDQPYGYQISRKIRITPEYGPLIPGRTEEKLVFGDSLVSYDLTSDPIVSGIDLVLTNPIYRTWIDNAGTKHFVPAQLFARKSGENIAFKVFIPHHSPLVRDEEYFGYCYPNGHALF